MIKSVELHSGHHEKTLATQGFIQTIRVVKLMFRLTHNSLIHSGGVSSLVHYVLKWLLPDLAYLDIRNSRDMAPARTQARKQSSLLSKQKKYQS